MYLTQEQRSKLDKINEQLPARETLDHDVLGQRIGVDLVTAIVKTSYNSYEEKQIEKLLRSGLTAEGLPFTHAKTIMELREGFNAIANTEDDELFKIEFMQNLDYQLGKHLYYTVEMKENLFNIFQQLRGIECPYDRAIYVMLEVQPLLREHGEIETLGLLLQAATLINSEKLPLVWRPGDNKFRALILASSLFSHPDKYVQWFVDSYVNYYSNLTNKA